MKATIYHGAGDVRVETVPDPTIVEPTDAVVRVVNAAICGSDLWFYRGIQQWTPGGRTGHEYTGVVEAVGSAVKNVKVGDFVIAPFNFSDGTCDFCHDELYTSCVHVGYWGGTDDGGQAEMVRVPYADGTLCPAGDVANDPKMRASLLALTDVMSTGHHGTFSAGTTKGSTVAIIGDGAVGLCAVLASRRLGAEKIIAIGHHAGRLEIAKQFGATEVYDSHDADLGAKIKESTKGGVPHVVEAVGNQETMDLSTTIVRAGGTVCFIGVPHQVQNVNLRRIFGDNLTIRGGVAPARKYIPSLLRDVIAGTLDPSPVFSQTLPLAESPAGYKAMDERRAIKINLEISAP